MVPEEPEGAAFGAAILGMYALELIPDISSISNVITIKKVYQPVAENHARYRQLFSLYERIYWKLQDEFAEIAEIQRTWK